MQDIGEILSLMEQRRGPDTYCDDLYASLKRLNEEARTLRERKRDESSS